MFRRPFVLSVAGLSLLAVAISGANCGWLNDSSKGEPTLRPFGSEQEFRSYLTSQATANSRNGGGNFLGLPMGNGFFLAPSAPMLAAAENSASDGAAGAAGSSYSTTNIQEVGVDESDIIKNNGETIYLLTGDQVHVVNAMPVENLAEVATISIDGFGNSLYLANNKLVVLSGYGSYGYGYGGIDVMPMPMPAQGSGDSSSSSGSASSGISANAPGTPVSSIVSGPWSNGTQTTVTLVDVTQPAKPNVDKIIRFEGSLASSRLIGHKLHLVLTTLPRLPENPTQSRVDAMTAGQWLPKYQKINSDGSTSDGNVASWQDCLRPSDPNGYAMTVVVTLDLDDPDAAFSATLVTANVGTIYASTEALYLTDTQYSYDNFSSRTDTAIHKLQFSDAGTEYVASGVVPGRPLSQYSLGEWKGYLRVATTNEQYVPRGESLSSGVYVLGLGADGSALETVGKIENIAPGEKIYSARFMGDRGFLVTFKRIDPLFVVDLSDATNPRIVGELKVPGYSDHIQLLDDHHLLTIGRDTIEVGDFAWVQGVLLTIFDVTDPADPKILKIGDREAREVIGGRGTYSEANSNPKAFNYYLARNALAFPVDLYEGQANGSGMDYGTHSFTGLYVYRVTVENGFEQLGRIASADGLQGNGCFAGYYGSTRGVFIDNNIFNVTDRGVRVASLDDIRMSLGQITFAGVQPLVQDCFWATVVPTLALPPSSDLR
ncbi:MAG: beta-propeller domain-containing protein [Phycisphaerae bacterium]|nr:beta-propeller domain-containing protein [Phycisphaerae bacterium]